MKKIIFALIALVAMPMMAQDYKIDFDNTDGDGHRMITCELVNVRSFTDKQVFNVGLGGFLYKKQDGGFLQTKSLRIKVNSNDPYMVDKGMLLLVKTVDGEVIQLKALNDIKALKKNTIWIGNNPVSSYGEVVTYNLTDDELAKLKKGIVKFRQEIAAGKHEKEYKKKQIQKVTDAIINHDKLINEALATEKSFDSDF